MDRRDAHQRGKPKGLVFDDPDLNITVWVKTWAEVINDAKARLHFVGERLGYQASAESANAYLEKAHARYIPKPEPAEAETEKAGEAPSE